MPPLLDPTETGILNDLHPFAFSVLNNKEDILTQSTMLIAADTDELVKVQETEICGLEEFGVFKYHSMSDIPSTGKLINAIWSYHHKWKPTGELLKHKASLCVDGSKQTHSVDYWEMYAPVVSWSTVCLMLTKSAILGLKSCQVDYTQPFSQAFLMDDVYMWIP